MVWPKRLIPNVKELAQREGPLRGRFHVDDAVRDVRVKSVKTVVEAHVVKDSRLFVLHEWRLRDADSRGQTAHLAVDVHRDVDVNVILHRFLGQGRTRNPVTAVPGNRRGGARKIGHVIHENAFGAEVRIR